MKINRKLLRQAVTDALAAHQAAHERRTAEWHAHQAGRQAAWVARHNPTWDQAALAIRRKVKKGEPITKADLPREHGNVAYYDPTGYSPNAPRDPGVYRAPYELAALGKALDVITDDEIAPTALRALGITGATLREAVGALGKAES